MYPTDVREFTTQRLVAMIADQLRAPDGPLQQQAYEELGLRPTATTSFHAAAAAVHVLLAHGADPSADTAPAPVLLAAHPNGHAPKAAAGEPAPARRRYARRKVASSSSSRKSRRTPTAAPLKCEVCGRPFRTQGRLTNHLRDRHGVGADQPQPTATVPDVA